MRCGLRFAGFTPEPSPPPWSWSVLCIFFGDIPVLDIIYMVGYNKNNGIWSGYDEYAVYYGIYIYIYLSIYITTLNLLLYI